MKTLLSLVILLLTVSPQTNTGSLTGRLLSLDGTPEAGVRVAVTAATIDPPGNNPELMSLAQTDSSGQYRLERIPPGKYFVVAGPLGSPSYYPGSPIPAKAVTVTITAGTTTNALDFILVQHGGIQLLRPSEAAGRLFGSVYDVSNNPIPNVTIFLTSNAQPEESILTSTNRTGSFEISGLSAGAFIMKVLSPVNSGYQFQGYEQLSQRITIRPNQGLEIGIKLRLAMRGTDIQLKRPDLYSLFSESVTRPAGSQISSSANAVTLDSGEFLLDPRTATNREGEVDLEVTFSNAGRLFAVRVMDPAADPDLARIAVEGTRNWRLSSLPSINRAWSSLKITTALYPARKN